MMNFFRLRVLNTFLFLLVGILIGAILRDRLHRTSAPAPVARYQPEYAQAAEGDDQPKVSEDTATDSEPEAAEEPVRRPVKAPAHAAPADDHAENVISLEPDKDDADTAADKPVPVLMITPAQFFKKPSAYAGRTVEMPLQMITTQRKKAGWRLNFVYTAADRSISYLYVTDDDSKLGEKPDLKVGYFYRVRFDCGSGDTAEDNSLISIQPTGEKSDWATGLSAVE